MCTQKVTNDKFPSETNSENNTEDINNKKETRKMVTGKDYEEINKIESSNTSDDINPNFKKDIKSKSQKSIELTDEVKSEDKEEDKEKELDEKNIEKHSKNYEDSEDIEDIEDIEDSEDGEDSEGIEDREDSEGVEGVEDGKDSEDNEDGEDSEEEIPPPLPDYKILENKKKIITRTRARDTESALILFFDTFSSYYPADLEFLNSFFTELSRINNYDCFYKIIQETPGWYKDNEDYEELSTNVTRLYIDNLILQGNNFVFERNERIEHIKRNTRRGDLNRDKRNLDNDKLLASFSARALEAFEKAQALSPENLPALNGLKNCYDYAGDFEKLEITLTSIEKILMKKRGIIVEEIEPEQIETKKETELAAFNQFQTEFAAISQLFNDERNEEFLEYFEEINNPELPYTPLILLKARVMARLRNFKESDELISIAEKENTHFPELNDAKTEIRMVKHKLYRKAGSYYLERALYKGVSFGQLEFLKAKEALENALHFVDDDIELLDQYYTVLMYLKKENDAFKTKGIIYSIDPTYMTSFDQQTNNRMCFIATFAYADKPSEVNVFRWFRREFLYTSNFGKLLNNFYMRYSPKMVEIAKIIPFASLLIRIILFLPLLMVKLLMYCFFMFNSDTVK